MAIVSPVGEVECTGRVQSENSRTELWWLLLLLLLLMLVGEVALTRKMVREGHTDLEVEESPGLESSLA